MPFHLTNAQLDQFRHSHDEIQMGKFVKLWRQEHNPHLKKRFYNEALHYFIQLPHVTKLHIEKLEHMNKRRRKR